MSESTRLPAPDPRWLLALALLGCSGTNPYFTVTPTGDAGHEMPASDGPPGHDRGPGDPSPETPPAGADARVDGQAADARVDGQAPDAPGPAEVGACAQGCAPLLHWRFDDEGVTTATDASGGGFHGTYTGDPPTLPVRSSAVPRTDFTNLYSRDFPASGRPGVQLANSVTVLALRTTDPLSVSAWFRATAAGGAGGDVVNVADSFLVRVKPTSIELAKRVSDQPGSSYEVIEIVGSSAHLDGAWHHVAGVLSATGMQLYLDGVMRADLPAGAPLIFSQTNLWVGRRDLGGTNNFRGGVDDVRVYRRALAPPEIQAMWRGEY